MDKLKLVHVTPEQLEHNKQLAKDKAAYGEFMSAEVKTQEGVEDGKYHKYTDEFKEANKNYKITRQ